MKIFLGVFLLNVVL